MGVLPARALGLASRDKDMQACIMLIARGEIGVNAEGQQGSSSASYVSAGLQHRMSVVCVCVCLRVSACVVLLVLCCVCVCERERERERDSARARGRARAREREREREREGERESLDLQTRTFHCFLMSIMSTVRLSRRE